MIPLGWRFRHLHVSVWYEVLRAADSPEAPSAMRRSTRSFARAPVLRDIAVHGQQNATPEAGRAVALSPL